MTVNGASLRTGVFTIRHGEGPQPDQYGRLMELSWTGQRPVMTGRGTARFLADDTLW